MFCWLSFFLFSPVNQPEYIWYSLNENFHCGMISVNIIHWYYSYANLGATRRMEEKLSLYAFANMLEFSRLIQILNNWYFKECIIVFIYIIIDMCCVGKTRQSFHFVHHIFRVCLCIAISLCFNSPKLGKSNFLDSFWKVPIIKLQGKKLLLIIACIILH